MSTEKGKWVRLCDAQEPSHKPGFIPAGGCWRERGHDGEHQWTPEVALRPAGGDA